MADAFCEMKGDTEKDRGNVRYGVKSFVKETEEGGRELRLSWSAQGRKRGDEEEGGVEGARARGGG